MYPRLGGRDSCCFFYPLELSESRQAAYVGLHCLGPANVFEAATLCQHTCTYRVYTIRSIESNRSFYFWTEFPIFSGSQQGAAGEKKLAKKKVRVGPQRARKSSGGSISSHRVRPTTFQHQKAALTVAAMISCPASTATSEATTEHDRAVSSRSTPVEGRAVYIARGLRPAHPFFAGSQRQLRWVGPPTRE